MSFRIIRTFVISVACAGAAGAQQVRVRQMEPPSATASESFGLVFGVHQFADGRLLVDDAEHRRLLLFDATLAKFTVVADTTPGPNNYGDSPSQILDFPGDTVLLLNYSAGGFLVIAPSGHIVRVTALPKASDRFRIFGARAVIDPQGRLIYRAGYPPLRGTGGRGVGTTVVQVPDSAPLVRADFETRTVDTIGRLKMPVLQKTYRTIGPGGAVSDRVVVTPLAWADDWIVTANGAVAIVRGQDYHIDWLNPDGTHTSTAKMSFDWLRIPDDEKQRLADSARAAAQGKLDTAKARDAASPRSQPPPGVTAGSRMMSTVNMADGVVSSMSMDATIEAAPLNEILDFHPPIRAGAVKADLDGNIWILPNTVRKAAGGIVYDVINDRGELFQRVQMPPERSIAGFGPGGVVYLMWRGASGAWHLEKSHVAR